MTRQQFISGTPFYIKRKAYKGDSTFYFSDRSISRQVRSSIDDKVILDTHECNIIKLGIVGFTGFTYVMGKRVNVKYRFDDLVQFQHEEA
jgi:hypothetical protein